MLALNTRIHIFCSHHLDQVARELLEAGAAVDTQNNEGWTALMYAAKGGNEQVCTSRTLSTSTVAGSTRLHSFRSHHLEHVARELLKAKCNVDAAADDGFTALMLSAQNGHEQVRRTRMPSPERVVRTA